jgi:hypothetical protein
MITAAVIEWRKRLQFIKSLYLNLMVKGKRGGKNWILAYGNVAFAIHRSARVNINHGSLRFNSGMRQVEPFPGMLELSEGSAMNIHGHVTFHSGCHVIVCKNAALELGGGVYQPSC